MPPRGTTLGNTRVFPEAMSNSKTSLCSEFKKLTITKPDYRNLVAENGQSLSMAPVQNHNNPFNGNKVNSEHPHAPFYQRLINSYQGHADINGDNVGKYDSYLDDMSDNHESNSEDEGVVEPKAPTNPSKFYQDYNGKVSGIR